jgi:hypothetical protein
MEKGQGKRRRVRKQTQKEQGMEQREEACTEEKTAEAEDEELREGALQKL